MSAVAVTVNRFILLIRSLEGSRLANLRSLSFSMFNAMLPGLIQLLLFTLLYEDLDLGLEMFSAELCLYLSLRSTLNGIFSSVSSSLE